MPNAGAVRKTPQGMPREMHRAEIARRTGVHRETVRYYEKIGLLAPPARSASGYRRYDSAAARRLGFVQRARQLGFSIEEIRALLRLADEPGPSCAHASRLAATHLADIRARVADLKRMARVLQDVVTQCGDGTRGDCPLIETLLRENPAA